MIWDGARYRVKADSPTFHFSLSIKNSSAQGLNPLYFSPLGEAAKRHLGVNGSQFKIFGNAQSKINSVHKNRRIDRKLSKVSRVN